MKQITGSYAQLLLLSCVYLVWLSEVQLSVLLVRMSLSKLDISFMIQSFRKTLVSLISERIMPVLLPQLWLKIPHLSMELAPKVSDRILMVHSLYLVVWHSVSITAGKCHWSALVSLPLWHSVNMLVWNSKKVLPMLKRTIQARRIYFVAIQLWTSKLYSQWDMRNRFLRNTDNSYNLRLTRPR